MHRIVCGPSLGSASATRQEILDLALRLGTAARALGLVVVTLKSSFSPGSPSRYLTLRDAGKRHWLVRISNHRMPVNNSQPLPHLDFVSLDGAAGLPEATAFLTRVATGAAHWFNAADPAHRAEFKRQRKRHRK